MGYLQGINQWLNTQLKKLETLTVVKLTTEMLIANTEIYAYSETTFGGPTIGREVYAIGYEMLVIVIWDTLSTDKKNSSQNPFCEPY